jgi:hypothetical protein
MEEGRASRPSRDPLAVAYQNAWEKLRKYYELTDDAYSIYAAALLLHPSHRKQYFDHHWQGEEEQWKTTMIQNVKKTWQTEYHTVPRQDRPPLQRQPTIVERHLRQAHTPVAYDDEFDSYINAPTTEFASPWDCIP